MVYPSVIFDLDGTLSDSSEGIMKGVRYAMERYGVTDIPEATLRRFIGPPLYDTFSQIFGLSPAQADHAVALYREYYLPQGMYENRLYPGIMELLERLPDLQVEVAAVPTEPAVEEEIEERVLSGFEQETAAQEQPAQAEETATEEPAAPVQDYPEGDPFSREETVSEPTRRINLNDLKFGRNYTTDGK